MPDFSEYADDAKKAASEHSEQSDSAFDKAAQRLRPLADLRRHSTAFGRDALRGLSAEGSVRARNLRGGPAAAAMRRYLRRLERR